MIEHEGVSYKVIVSGGFGWSAGCGSTIQAMDGPFAGELYKGDIGSGIHNLYGPFKHNDKCPTCFGKGEFSRSTTIPSRVCIVCSGSGIYTGIELKKD